VILFFCGSAIAQTNVIGNPIKIGNIEVAQYDFPDDMEWDDANRKCLNLSEGWRLPTKDELKILYDNKKQIENNNHPHKAAYWSSTEKENDNAWWYIYLPYGQFSTREKKEKLCVRAVRSVGDIERRAEANLITNSIIINDIEVQKLDLPNRMTWAEAKAACSILGPRWRLPTRGELKLLYQNTEKIGGLKINSNEYYWGINDSNVEDWRWAQCMQDGGTTYGDASWYLNVRVVRTIIKYDESDAGKEIRKVTIPFPNGGKYVGEVKDGDLNGQGTLSYAGWGNYVGEWKNDKRNGQGTITNEGTWEGKYVGEWKDDKKNGRGTYSYKGGGNYVGEWKDDKKNGQGTMTDADWGNYVGEWKDDKKNGQGILTYAETFSQEGGNYVGEWKDDKKNGKGTYSYKDGSKYIGEWKDDDKNGQGTYTSADGSKYIGEFKYGEKNGQGTYTPKNGSIQKGIFENGVYTAQRKDVIVKNTTKTTKQERDSNVPSGVGGFSQQELLNLIIKSQLSDDASGLDPSSQFYSKPSNSNDRNNSSSSNSRNSSSNSSSKHTFKVLITWNNPNCGTCSFPSPSAQNGIVDYFYARSGSYRVKPVCPICGKKQYNTVDGFTNNIGTSNQGSKVATITCN